MDGPGSGVSRGCGMRQRALACVLVAAACGGASQSNVRPLGGILTVAPATLDFGDVALGREQTHRVVLRNTGLVSMTVGQLAQFADPAFEVKGLPATLGPGSAVDVAVRYRPPGLGTHERMLPSQQSIVVRLKFRSDRLGSFSSAIPITPCPTCSPRSITLTGKGVDKLLLVRPETLDFGELRLAAEATQPFTVTNTSKGP